NVQRAYPAGGCEQASAVKRACCSPSSTGVTAGANRGLRCSSDSGPDSTACWRHDSTLRVLQPYAAATKASVQPEPSDPWSHWSSACARWSFQPAALPFVTSCSSSARSSAVSLSTYFLATARPP